jgi:hypothetical protein
MGSIGDFFEKQRDPEKFKGKRFGQKLAKYGTPVIPDADEYHFKHSGNIGDIIYAIPAIKAVAGKKPIHLHLNVNQKVSYGKNIHPLGNVMLNEKMVEMIRPLLLSQPGFVSCEIWNGAAINVDLDAVRKYPLLLNRGHISRWYFLIFGVHYPLDQPWITVDPDSTFSNAIVVARSQRYHAPGIDYRFLRQYPEVYFIGLADEYKDIKKQVPHIHHRPVTNFLEMARIIAGCGLFIGNQSFSYALAEAMKVKRLLEWYFLTPNVMVDGPQGFDFCLQPHFERLVATHASKNI